MTNQLNPEWIQGFFQFTSTFQFLIAKTKNRNTCYIATNPTFEVNFPKHSEIILHSIKNYFQSGYIKNNNTVSRLIFNNEEKIIEFLDKFPLIGKKNEVYKDWKKLIKIKNKNIHKTEKGIKQIIMIKNSINKLNIY